MGKGPHRKREQLRSHAPRCLASSTAGAVSLMEDKKERQGGVTPSRALMDVAFCRVSQRKETDMF